MSIKPALYAAKVSPLLTDPALFAQAYAVVPSQRQEKADRYRRREDAALSLGVELLLRHAHRQEGLPVPHFYITHNYGKPFAGGEMAFSLSHSGAWALCAVGGYGNRGDDVGCDVEKIDPAHVESAARAFTASEQAFLNAAANEEERVHRFFRVWTLKESYAKATSCECALYPSEFSVTPGVLHAVPSAPAATCREYDDIPGYACAMCRLHGGELPSLQVVDLRAVLQDEKNEVNA